MKSWKKNIGNRIESRSILDEWTGSEYIPVIVRGIISGYRTYTNDNGLVKKLVTLTEVFVSNHTIGGIVRAPWKDGEEFDVTFAEFELL